MRSTWKRTLATVLTIALMASLLIVPASAADRKFHSFEGNNTTDAFFVCENSGTANALNGSHGNGATITNSQGAEVTLTGGSKIGGSSTITFTAPDAGTCTLYLSSRASGVAGIKVNSGTAITPVDVKKDGATVYCTVTFDTEAETEYKISRATGNMDALYIEWDPSGPATPSITVTPATAEVEVEKTTTLTATVENADGATVEWSSSNDSVATVANGVVTGVAASEDPVTITAKITVDGTDYTATAAVTVVAAGSVVYVDSVTIAGDSTISLAEGGDATLTATVAGAEGQTPADTTVTWSTSDADVATVSAEGKVTAVGAGTATITATSNGDKSDGTKATASVTVTVTAKPKLHVFDTSTGANVAHAGTDFTSGSGVTADGNWIKIAQSSGVGTTTGAETAYKGGSVKLTRPYKINNNDRTLTVTAPDAGKVFFYMQHPDAVTVTLNDVTKNIPAGNYVLSETVTKGQQLVMAKGNGNANVFAVLWTPAEHTDHTWGAAVDNTAATCGEAGTEIKWCTNDACFAYETEAGDAATGEHAEYAWKTVTDATDDADGVRAYVCKVCGAAGTAPDGESTVIPKLSHTATVTATGGTVALSGEGVTDNGDGSYKIKNGSTVTVTATAAEGYEGGAVTVDGTAITGTTFEMPAADVAVAATFTQKVPVITVSKANVDVNVNKTATVTVTVANGDAANVTVSSSADATATAAISGGVITITGVAEGTATITVALTDAESKTIAVTVHAEGTHVHHYQDDGKGEVTTAANCVEAGVMTYTCQDADCPATDKGAKTEPIAIDPTNHKGPTAADPESAEEPTCGEAGKAADTVCDACGKVVTAGAVIPATGQHTFQKDGEELEECEVCGEPNPDYKGDALWDLDFTASAEMAKDATVESVDGVKLTVGSIFKWHAANAAGTTGEETLSAEAGMAGVLKGDGGGPSNKAAVPADGKSYLKFDATKDGSLMVAYAVFGSNAKTVYVVDKNGAAVAGAGETNFTGNGYSEFDVEAGGTYYVYAGGANIGFYGFSFTADQGGDEPTPPTPETKTITFTVGDGTTVTDIKVGGVAAQLVAGKLTGIAKDAVVTFQAAVTDAAKTLKVTGATFADGVYTVTADTVVTTAVAADEYTITCDTAVGGTVTTDKTVAKAGDTVTVTATPATGYKLEAIKVDGVAITGTTFTMPAKDVTVSATFVAEGGQQPEQPNGPTTGVFTFDIGEMVTAGKLTVESHAGGDPAPQLSDLGTEGLFTIITKKSGGSTIEERSDKHVFEDGYAGTHQFKTGGSASDMAKLESEGKAIKFTTGAVSTVKVWWVSGSGSGSSLALANKSGDADPVQFYADAEKSAQNVGVIATIENVPAGVNYLYSPDGTARFYKVVVAVGDSKLPDGGDQPGPGPDQPGTDDPADTAALTAAIADATKLAGAYTVRPDTTVISNVAAGNKYVLQSDKDALDAAIAAAQAVAAKTDATQAEVDAAVAALNAAMDAFNGAVKTGTKTSSGGSSGGGSSVRGDRGDSSATSTTTKTNPDGSKVQTEKKADGSVTITTTTPDGEVIAQVTIPATIASVGYKFVDVPDEHWAAKSINDMAGLGMVQGVDNVNHIFDMNSNITRGSVAAILFRFAKGKTGMSQSFTDVAEGQWYTDAVAWANNAGVVTGFEDGSFRPDGNITREQLAVMIARFAKLIGMDTTSTGSLVNFKDSAKVQAWAVDGVTWCVANGIINGRGDGIIDPSAPATRAEAAAMLDRFVQLLK